MHTYPLYAPVIYLVNFVFDSLGNINFGTSEDENGCALLSGKWIGYGVGG
ncbi:hypothetical protein [Spirosoma validum]|uniref:Uncharacterized protein n=1 Tax=Spirosoma validum TaxID=2771355 RepID=A0A927GDN0_9BACT|nr:hypothetical protein [Spirosoma validum]MBD2753967.1 hypothetical protein [Spirosoma validum]